MAITSGFDRATSRVYLHRVPRDHRRHIDTRLSFCLRRNQTGATDQKNFVQTSFETTATHLGAGLTGRPYLVLLPEGRLPLWLPTILRECRLASSDHLVGDSERYWSRGQAMPRTTSN